MGNELFIANASQDLFQEVLRTVPVEVIYAGSVCFVTKGVPGDMRSMALPEYEGLCAANGVAPYTFDEYHFTNIEGFFTPTSQIRPDTKVREDRQKRTRLALEGRLAGKRTHRIDVDLSHVKEGRDLKELKGFLLDQLVRANYDIKSTHLALDRFGGMSQTELNCVSGGTLNSPGVYLKTPSRADGEEMVSLRSWFVGLQDKYGKL